MTSGDAAGASAPGQPGADQAGTGQTGADPAAESAAESMSAGTSAAGDSAPGAGVPGGSAPACDCPVKLFLADAGYLSEDNLTIAGPDRLIATGKHRDLEKQARAGGNPKTSARSGAITAMAARLATEEGITAYRQRGHIAETPHGHIKHNMGFRQLSMRGMPKAAAEWTFAATVHNLFKAITTGHLTTAALDSLAPQPA